MAASAGVLRSEALLTARAAHFVCVPGTGHADRIITARATEYAHGLVLLRLSRSMRPVDRRTPQAACATARKSLRAGASEEEVHARARASGLLRDQGAAAAEAPAVLAGAEDKAVDASASLGGPSAPAVCAPLAIALRSLSTHAAAAFERGRSWAHAPWTCWRRLPLRWREDAASYCHRSRLFLPVHDVLLRAASRTA